MDWQDIDMKINGNKTYIVRAFGRDDCGMSHCWTVIGFQPYFYIKFEDNEIGDFKNIRDFYYNKIRETFKDCENDDEEDDRLDSYLSHEDREEIMAEEIVCIKIEKRKLFKYFTNNKLFNFMKMSFKTKRAMRQLSTLIKKHPIIDDRKLELFESNIEPLIRFFHNKNINPSGWLYSSRLHEPKYECSKCDIEKWVQYDDLEVMDKNSFAPLESCF